jgi:endothelin-converting enzyme
MHLDVSSRSADKANFEKMKAVYDACLDEAAIRKQGVAPLTKVLKEIKDTFSASTSGKPVVKDTILLLAKYGVSALVTAGTGADDKDPDTIVVSVSPPWTIGLPSKERYEDEKLVEKYQAVLTKVLVALYPDQDKDSFFHVVDLEKKLAAASPDQEDLFDVTVRVLYPLLQIEAK